MKIQRLTQHRFLWLLLAVLLGGTAHGQWSYTYIDNFASKKTQSDSYAHSRFWTEGTTPLPGPYLYFQSAGLGGGLAFIDHLGDNAELAYCFPIGAAPTQMEVTGTLQIDVSFPSNANISQWNPGNLSYTVSGDGAAWSDPVELGAGHHVIPIPSLERTSYIMFSGTRVVINNLRVDLQGPLATYVSPTSGTIQAAIDSAQDGDVIEVAPGTYSGPGNQDIDFRGKSITVRSAAGPEATIIDCGANGDGHRGFYFHEAEGADAIVSGFTVRGGRVLGAQVPSNPQYWNPSAAHPVGGGIYCEFSSPSIVNCIIEDCGAEIGGGIGIVGGAPTITRCVITDCQAGGFGGLATGGKGAGIGLIGATGATISNSVIANNLGYSNSQGGGIYCSESTAVIAGCDITDNTAPGALDGGGLYCEGDGTNVTLKHSVISANVAAAGGGVYTTWSGWTASQRPHVEVVNCTIADNQLSGSTYLRSGGIQSSNTDILVTNSIVWANEGSAVILNNPTSSVPVTYSAVQGGYPGTGNIGSNPVFAGAGDYHLKSHYGRYRPEWGQWTSDSQHSPCIDAGDPSISAVMEPSPNGGRINMGAYGNSRQASMGPQHHVYHVDAVNGRDYYSGLSQARAFPTIQMAVDTAAAGDIVLVWPGTYTEDIIFENKAITVQSAADAAVIVAAEAYAFSFYQAESSMSTISNFVIRGCPRGAVFCSGASPTLKNLTMVGNDFGVVVGFGGGDPYIVNCILWSNTHGDLSDCKASYSCVQHGTPDRGAGNINTDPLFADPLNHDYHLKSRYGRYVPQLDDWVTDATTSPCINEGDPDEYPRAERTPNGNRINMGAYGGTPYASVSDWPSY